MYLTLDLETSSKEAYGKKANYTCNKILCIGLKYQKKIGTGQFDRSFPEPNEYIEDLFALEGDVFPNGWLKDVTIIILHNAAFDLKFIWRLEELQEFFKRGGRIWDTAAAEFIISKQQHKFPKLRDIAVNKYGCEFREKNIEKFFESGLDTTDADIELLLEDVKNDVMDTEAVALQQLKISKEQGTFNLIAARMDSLLATIEMEYNGIPVNYNVFYKNKKLLTDELESCKVELQEYVNRYWKYDDASS